MQHNARDPNRDHVHGRVYRITYPERPLVKPAKIAGATIDELLENLKLHEYRSRYRTHRELRGHETKSVTAALAKWIPTLTDERHLLEALWVSWGANQINENLLKKLLKSEDHRVRAAQYKFFNSTRPNSKTIILCLQQPQKMNTAALELRHKCSLISG